MKIDWERQRALCLEIVRQIYSDNWRPDYIVGITRGGLVPAVMLSHYLQVPCKTLMISLRDSGECESNLWMAEEAFGYVPLEDQEKINSRWDPSYRKNILIVDDINDSGASINWLVKDWGAGCMPSEQAVWKTVWNNSVRFAVLVDNLSSNCSVDIDYCGAEIDKSENNVWVDFPWEQWWKI
jgi:uncharacterized protein